MEAFATLVREFLTAFGDNDPGLVDFFEASVFDSDMMTDFDFDVASLSLDPGDLDLFSMILDDPDLSPVEAAFLTSAADCCFFAAFPNSRPIPVLVFDWVGVFSDAFLTSLDLPELYSRKTRREI